MKKLLRISLLVCALALLLCIGVLAAEGDPTTQGMYHVKNNTSGVNFVPNGSGTEATVDGKNVTFYADAVKGSLQCTGLTKDAYYLVLVTTEKAAPSTNNLVYINQATADASGEVTFPTVYPSSLANGTYYIYITGAGKSFNAANPDAQFDNFAPYKLGDVNNDNQILSNDALFALQMSVGLGTWTPTQKLAADVNKNGSVMSNDALFILQKSVGLPTVF